MEDSILFYFSGSGNSLVVAQEIQGRLGNIKLVEIAHALKSEYTQTKAKVIGFVFPCHGLTIPLPVKIFLEQLDISKSQYIFAIATRSGTVFKGFDCINKILNKKSKALDAGFIIDMPSSDPKYIDFKVPTYEEVMSYHKGMENKLSIIADAVENMDEYQDDTEGVKMSKGVITNKMIEKLVSFSAHNIAPKQKNYFYTTDDCIGCGTCEKICPAKKISIKDNKPSWSNNTDCYMCYACINFCPIEAIQINSKYYFKSHTLNNGRYHHPHVTPQDMIND